MLTLNNVGKVYATRRKRKIYGLHDVNLTFPDKGLCLILGKSGCGKTTLLNILGGLDAKYEGKYVFMGKKLEQKDFSELRQNHISFVFQDFNLIDEYSVAENIALGIKLSQDSAEDVETVLRKVGLEGYGERYPKELSGGQQQRVAIARAILKQSSLLLADEPTGNLDKENSIEIYNLLKEISKDKLVIIVSHDEELGLQYADYTVRLHKGQVTADNLPSVRCDKQYVAGSKHAVSNKQAFKMGAREITRQKVKSALTIALMAVCFCVLSFTILAVPLFKMSDVHYSLIKDKGYEYVNLTNVTYDEYLKMKSNGIEVIVGDSQTILTDSQRAEELGFEFYDGALPLEPNSYYVSDYSLRKLTIPDMMGRTHNEAIINGEETRFSMERMHELVGQIILNYGRDKICAGIFKSDLDVLDDEFNRYSKPLECNIISPVLEERFTGNVVNITATYDDKQIDIGGEFRFECFSKSYVDKFVLTSDGIVNVDDGGEFESVLNANEIIVGVEMFNKIFQMQHSVESLLEKQQSAVWNAKRIPEELGRSITITTENGVVLKDLVVKGILFEDDNGILESGNEIIFSNERLSDRNLMIMATRTFDVWVVNDSVKNLKGLLATHSNYFKNCDIYSPVTKYESDLRKSFNTVQISLLGVSLVLIAATVLMTSLLISGQITGQKKKIGIYKALGAKNGDIKKIFLYEMLIIALPMIILAIASTAIVTAVLNRVYVKEINIELTLLYYQWVNVPITVFAVCAVLFIGVIAPLRKITKLNVIDAIKDSARN